MEDHIYTAEELNNDVCVRLGRSEIAGIGVIAIRDIPPNTQIGRLPPGYVHGRSQLIFTHEEWNKISPDIKEILLDRNCYLKDFRKIGYYICDHPNAHQEYINFMNHAKDANSNGYTTNREIKKGEEITEVYWSMGIETREHMNKKGLNI